MNSRNDEKQFKKGQVIYGGGGGGEREHGAACRRTLLEK